MGSFLNKRSVDLIVTGPPYWNEIIYSEDAEQLSRIGNYETFLEQLSLVWAGCADALKPGGIMALWVHDFFDKDGENYIPFHADILRTFPKNLTPKTISIWDRYLHKDRGNPATLSQRGTRYQYVIILQKEGHHSTNDTLIKTSLRKYFWHPIWGQKTNPKLLGSSFLYRIIFYLTLPFSKYLIKTKIGLNNLRLIKDSHEFRNYPSECPEEIAEKLIIDFSQKNDTVLDPFLGSGTTMKVAQKLHRNCIGIEINSKTLSALESKVGLDNINIHRID